MIDWTAITTVLSVYIVGVLIATPSVAARYRRGKAWMDRCCGAVIVALGIRQLVR